MNKNDRIIAIIGVVILIIASIGITTWNPGETMQQVSSIDDFLIVSSSISHMPDAVAVSDKDPFYALIATPLSVHYTMEGKQEIIPMYVQNFSSPSRAISRAEEQIEMTVDEFIDDSQSAKEWSLEIAKKYWNSSEAILIIENNESGYNLGVMATPLASYLGIPIIVTDRLDHHVREVLTELGVKKTMICGENIEGYGEILRFNTVEEIVNNTIELLIEKFGTIDYITITNPVDVWPPEVLDSEQWTFQDTFSSMATTELVSSITAGTQVLGTFTIPNDYKYALVKFKGININDEHVNELGDNVLFMCGVTDEDEYAGLQQFEVFVGGTGGGGVPVRDDSGNIVEDITYNEAVLYDRGGMEYQITVNPSWLASNQGEVRAEIIVEKLSDPIYPMMKGLSSVAPYLTAYRKGLIFGKPEFAFAADDDALYMGETCPGFYMPRRNPRLIDASNDHIFSIHEEINQLLEKLAGITRERDYDLKYLREYYKNNPVYIALVGGATVLPQYIYDTPSMPAKSFEDVSYYVGAGVPSDFIYGNIDPKPGEWSSQTPDIYSEYPFQENIIGRITGWDVQDASALIARTIFYDKIIDDMNEWKDNAAVQLGGGNDFQKPFLRYKLFGEILGMTHRGEPMKMWTGASYINGFALEKNVEELGFDTEYIRENTATYQGFSNEAIDIIKKANLINTLFLSKQQVKKNVGVDAAIGGELQENSNFILANAHGNQHMFGMGDVGIYKLGIGLSNGILEKVMEKIATLMGFGPGLSLSDHGYYSTRNVENMDLGPSFLWIESCICGKIDGVYPKQGISQAYIHSGCNAVIAASTSSNVPGGYLEGKSTKYDFPGQTMLRYIQAKNNLNKGIYPEMHFGFKIYSDLCEELKTEDTSIGFAYREARNRYLPEDAEWPVWWTPPLILTGLADVDAQIFELSNTASNSDLEPRLDNKYLSFYEYHLYGDPAFVPYVPITS